MDKSVVIFQPEGRRHEIEESETLLEVAREIGLDIQSVCGGKGTCGKCRVIVRAGIDRLSLISKLEKRLLTESEIANAFRLACQTTIHGQSTIVVEVPHQSRVGKQRLLLKGLDTPVALRPSVTRLVIHLRKPSLTDVKADVERLLEAIRDQTGGESKVSYETLRQIPNAIREGNWTVSVVLRADGELISVRPADQLPDLYGVAVDIGSTKVAAYLLDLITGEIAATAPMTNPQIPYGEDIISRILYIMRGEKNLGELQRVIVSGINQLIEECCEKARIQADDIYDMTAVGNTAMHHIFLGVNPTYLSLSPYPAVLQSSMNLKARELGIRANPGAYVHTLPNIAGFVGADAVADVLATGIYKSESTKMVIDIGTNTEIIVGKKDWLMACSCASGPALEGAQIKHGMRAGTGAIEHVWVDPETLELGYQTIDNGKPIGLCGSGIVDAVAQMLSTHLIMLDGRFNPNAKTERIRRNGNIFELVIAWRDETSTENDIVITQNDVREVQKAKAAIYAGTSILMKHINIKPQDIQKIFVAGAFGNYVDPQSGKIIGMFPDVSLQNIEFVGNTAGSGARMALLSTEIRMLADRIARQIEYLELGADPEFMKEFLNATYFPHREAERFPHVMKILTGK